MDLAAHRQMNFSAMYERLASSMLLKRYIRGDSLVYAFTATQKRLIETVYSLHRLLPFCVLLPPLHPLLAS